MRTKIFIEGFKFEPDYFTKLLNTIHRWIGSDKELNKITNYSYSHIWKNHFVFSSLDESLQQRLIEGAMKDPYMWDDVRFVRYDQYEHRTDKDVYGCLSPFFVKDKYTGNHMLFDEGEERAKEILIRRAESANIMLGEFDLKFINKNKHKLININGINNKCFTCSVKITGSDVVKNFASKVGIGNSTGVGFGFIY